MPPSEPNPQNSDTRNPLEQFLKGPAGDSAALDNLIEALRSDAAKFRELAASYRQEAADKAMFDSVEQAVLKAVDTGDRERVDAELVRIQGELESKYSGAALHSHLAWLAELSDGLTHQQLPQSTPSPVPPSSLVSKTPPADAPIRKAMASGDRAAFDSALRDMEAALRAQFSGKDLEARLKALTALRPLFEEQMDARLETSAALRDLINLTPQLTWRERIRKAFGRPLR